MRRDHSAIGAALAILGSLAAAGPASAELAAAAPLGYTGAEQSYTVPPGVTWMAVTAAGAPGWDTTTNQTGSVGDNNDGYEVYGMLPVTPAQQLFAEVGQAGLVSGAATFGGGGAGGAGSLAPGASGGGASDVRTCSIKAATCTGGGSSLASRLIVGAGGGGSGGDTQAANAPSDLINSLGGDSCTQGAALSSCATQAVTGGTVIEGGGAYGGNPSAVTPAGGGTSAGGTAGSIAASTFKIPSQPNCTLSSSAAGSAGLLGIGAAGGSGNANGGGGGGGGYFGGGGGASGRVASGDCSTPPPTGIAVGGGTGSSFLSSQLINTSFSNHASNSGVVTTASVTLQPLIVLTAPASGARYTQGQVVDAAYDCFTGPLLGEPTDCQGSEQAGGATSPTTVATGSAIDTSAVGQHTFTVKNAWASGPAPVQTAITYTVVPAAITPTGRGEFSGITGKHPKLELTVAANKGAAGLSTLVIGPPAGVSFVRKGLKQGLAIGGTGSKAFTDTLDHGSLMVKTSAGVPSLTVTLQHGAIKLSKGFVNKAKSKKPTSVTFTVEVTDSAGATTKLSIKVKI